MFQNTKDIKKLKEEIIELKENICCIEMRYIEQIQEVREIALKKANIAWDIREEEIEFIEGGKKLKKIRKLLS